MPPAICLKPLFHRQQECIGVHFSYSSSLDKTIRKIDGIKWSQTHRCWYLPLSRENCEKVFIAMKGKAGVDAAALHAYLVERKKMTGVSAITRIGSSAKMELKTGKENSPDAAATGAVGRTKVLVIHPVNEHVLPAMRQHLVLRSYSASTIKTYLNEAGVFLRTIKHHAADEFSTQRIKDYLQYCAEKLALSENTLHSRINALKFYFEQVLKKERFFWDIPRPKKVELVPKVISKEEMVRLIKAIKNVKHKTMIMLGYGCGLRVSEITRLEIRDIDEDRRLLLIRKSKGKKDRIVSLSPVVLVILREYLLKYKPEKYLFEGQKKGSPYSNRSLELIIKTAKQKAGINKAGSMHMLRHSFATHLLDKGTDVVFIQKILGHNDLKTTLRYLHVTNKDLVNILSPIEDIKDFL
jgi:site-specific recombinase XerD